MVDLFQTLALLALSIVTWLVAVEVRGLARHHDERDCRKGP